MVLCVFACFASLREINRNQCGSPMLVYLWLVFVFIIGAVVGSFLNVCIARLPLEKSLLWPGSHCGNCYQPIRWYDNLPLISYLWLRGRCRSCGAGYSIRYWFVELLTALGFVGLFYVEVVRNIHGWYDPNGNGWLIAQGFYPWQAWVGFGFHAILFSFLMAASFCDIAGREIPLALTLTGTAVGLVGAVLLPWPWPLTPEEGLSRIHAKQQKLAQFRLPQMPQREWWMPEPEWIDEDAGPRQGVYPWPVWGPLPDWLPPGRWPLGLATGLAGLLMGTFFLRLVGFLFRKGLQKEALGLGDADLMMMAGAFLGWQPVVVAFFLSVFPALFVGLFQMVVHRDEYLPFGPSLALGILITMLGWGEIGPHLQVIFFWWPLLMGLILLIGSCIVLISFVLRLLR